MRPVLPGDQLVEINPTNLLVRLVGPVLPDGWITEVCHLLQHGSHESGTQLSGIRGNPPLLRYYILPVARVEVEGWQAVQEGAAAMHVPEGEGEGVPIAS